MLVNQEDRRFHEKESPSEVECCEADVDEPSSDSLQLLITDVLDIIQEDSNQGDSPFCLNYTFAFFCFRLATLTVYLVIIDGNDPMRPKDNRHLLQILGPLVHQCVLTCVLSLNKVPNYIPTYLLVKVIF